MNSFMIYSKRIICSIFLTIIVIFTYSCSFILNCNPIGLYGECEKKFYACTQLELKEDSTFTYYIFLDVGGLSIIKGTWKIFEDTLILNTFNQPDRFHKRSKIYKTKFIEKYDSTITKGSKIEVVDGDNLPFGYANILINDGSIKGITDTSGIYYSDNDNISLLQYQFLDLNEKFIISNNKSNYFKIIARDIDFNVIPSYLTDEKYILKNGKIYYRSKADGKFVTEYSLKKTNIKKLRFERQ